MGAGSCGTLRSHVPALLNFSFAFCIATFLYNIFLHFPVLPRSCFAFLVYVWGWGSNSSHALCVYGWIRRAGSTRHHTTTPSHHKAQCTSQLSGSRFEVKLVSRPQSPPSTSPLSTCHNCVISLQERELSVPILSHSAVPHSCIKCAFPSARVPKIPGAQEPWNAKQGTRTHLCSNLYSI